MSERSSPRSAADATVPAVAPSATASAAQTAGSVGLIAIANAAVAGLGFVGNYILANGLTTAAFAAITLFLAAFQFLQEAMGRSLNWAVLRLAPVASRERPDGADLVLAAARSLQLRFAVLGPLLVGGLAFLAHRWIDPTEGTSRALMLSLAAITAGIAVLFQFRLGVLQLRAQFAALGAWMAAQSALRLLAWWVLTLALCLDLATGIAAHVGTTALVLLGLIAWQGKTHPRATPGRGLATERRRLLRFGGHMVLATTLAAVAAQIDLFLLGDEATANLRVAALFATAIELATSAVMTVLLPQSGAAHSAAEQRRSLRRGLRLGGGVALGALLTLPAVLWVLPLLFPRYAAATALYPILLGGVVLTALTDPLGLLFVSRDRPHRFVILNAMLLLIVLAGNALCPGDDRALVAAWVRCASRAALAFGIVLLLWRDARRTGKTAESTCYPSSPDTPAP